MEGKVIGGKYEIIRLVGKGGMGRVYEARHQEVQRTVAIKLLRPELAVDPKSVERFRREAVAAGRLEHDNICEVFDFGHHEDMPYYVMPLLRGVSLSKAIKRSGAMPVSRAVCITTQILDALGAAHATGLIHRDLKPDNIFLIQVAGQSDFVKILDFGISKMASPGSEGESSVTTLTESGAVLGTPCYLSPEQARGDKAVDSRTDLYATAVILYEMLAGQRPIDGDSYNEILWKIWNVAVPAIRSMRRDLPSKLQEVIHRGMSRDRDDRYPDAESFRKALIEAAEATAVANALDVTLPTKPDDIPKREARQPEPSGDATTELSSSDESQQARSTRRSIAVALSVVMVVLALGMLTLSRLLAFDQQMTPPATQQDDDSPPPGPESLVTITLEGIPEGARVLLDGDTVEGRSMQRLSSPYRHELRVEHDGHAPWKRTVSFDRDQRIRVDLRPMSTPAEEEPGSRNPSSRQSQKRPRKQLSFDRTFPDP